MIKLTCRPLELFLVMLMMMLGESNYYYYYVHFTGSETEAQGACTSEASVAELQTECLFFYA